MSTATVKNAVRFRNIDVIMIQIVIAIANTDAAETVKTARTVVMAAMASEDLKECLVLQEAEDLQENVDGVVRMVIKVSLGPQVPPEYANVAQEAGRVCKGLQVNVVDVDQKGL